MPGIIFWPLLGVLVILSSAFGKDAAMAIFVASSLAFAAWLFKVERDKKSGIREKYSESVSSRILKGECWIGQTKDQLKDSLGFPEKVETQESAEKYKEVWKFFYKNSRRVKLKITIINGVVVQIDEK